MTAPSETAVSPTILDPDGDLLLTVGALPEFEPQVFKVSASAMRRASPVWKAMLFGDWAESKKDDGQEWRASLPKDDPTATGHILTIVHLHFHRVPKDLPIPDLFSIVVVADKYKMLGCLSPWVDGWVKGSLATGCTRSPVCTVQIAWQLGHEPLFLASVRQLCLEAEETGRGLGCKEGGLCVVFEHLTFAPEDLSGK